MGDTIRVGVILGAHGIKGEVKLRSFTDDPLAIVSYGPLASASGEVFEITRIKPQKDNIIVSFKGTNDRNKAETLRGIELFVPRERLPAPAEDEVYAHDLIGLPVVHKDGRALGIVAGVPNYGAGDLLEVKAEGRRDTVLIPFHKSYVLERVAGKIVVDLPEGYLDETR